MVQQQRDFCPAIAKRGGQNIRKSEMILFFHQQQQEKAAALCGVVSRKLVRSCCVVIPFCCSFLVFTPFEF
jgi:hypothetical protein